MRQFIIVAFVISVVFLFSCDHDEDVNPETLLTVTVDKGFLGIPFNWVFVTDADGNLLDVKRYTQPGQIILRGASGQGKINVTFFFMTRSGVFLYDFDTYAGVERGTTLHFVKPKDGEIRSASGSCHFLISNYYGPSRLMSFTSDITNAGRAEVNNGVLDGLFYYLDRPVDFLMTGYRSGVPVYSWARNVENDELIERDFETDFEPFPQQLVLNFEGSNTGYVYGIKADGSKLPLIDSYRLAPELETDHPTIGAIDGFAAYETLIFNTNANGAIFYQKKGTFPSGLTIPKLTVVKNNIYDLSYTYAGDYTYSTASWADDIARWNFISLPGTPLPTRGFFVPGAINDEIPADYPKIDPSRFIFYGLSFTKTEEGKSHLDFMPGKQTPETWERFEFSVKP